MNLHEIPITDPQLPAEPSIYTRVNYERTDDLTGRTTYSLEVIQGGSIYLRFTGLTPDEADMLAPLMRRVGIDEFRFGPMLDEFMPQYNEDWAAEGED